LRLWLAGAGIGELMPIVKKIKKGREIHIIESSSLDHIEWLWQNEYMEKKIGRAHV
jgi:hypothetical protein